MWPVHCCACTWGRTRSWTLSDVAYLDVEHAINDEADIVLGDGALIWDAYGHFLEEMDVC